MFFSFLLQWLVPQVNYWWKVVRMGSFSCFTILKENIQYFNIKYNISFRIFSWMSLIKLRRFPPITITMEFELFLKPRTDGIFCQMLFKKSLKLLSGFFPLYFVNMKSYTDCFKSIEQSCSGDKFCWPVFSYILDLELHFLCKGFLLFLLINAVGVKLTFSAISLPGFVFRYILISWNKLINVSSFTIFCKSL